MLLRLDEAERLANDLGYACERNEPHELTIVLRPGIALEYLNWPDRNDNMIAFGRSDWHCHDCFGETLDDGSYVQCDELEILVALSVGELLVVSLCLDGAMQQRWLQHRREPLLLHHIESGRELRVQDVAMSTPER